MKLIEPKYIILDEIDSGLDLDAIKLVSELIENVNNENNTFIVITHNFSIINKLPIDKIYIVKSGEIVKT
jgi:Fe-S cluster assembly ATP-binding protein